MRLPEPHEQTLRWILSKDLSGRYVLVRSPRGVQEVEFMKEFSRRLRCTNEAVEGCTCRACTVNADEHTFPGQISVNEVRELIQEAKKKPHAAKVQVFLLLYPQFSREAVNALLKMLEETPGHTWFLHLASEHDLFPEALTSRAYILKLHHLPSETVRELARDDMPQEVIGVMESSGSLQIMDFVGEEYGLELFNLLFKYLHDPSVNIHLFHKVLGNLPKSGEEVLDCIGYMLAGVQEFGKWTPTKLERVMRKLEEARRQIRAGVQAKHAVFNLLLNVKKEYFHEVTG